MKRIYEPAELTGANAVDLDELDKGAVQANCEVAPGLRLHFHVDGITFGAIDPRNPKFAAIIDYQQARRMALSAAGVNICDELNARLKARNPKFLNWICPKCNATNQDPLPLASVQVHCPKCQRAFDANRLITPNFSTADVDDLLADLYQYVEHKQSGGETDPSYDAKDSALLDRIVAIRRTLN